MAWWNQPEGSVTPTVTLRRLAAWMAERGHRYDLDLSEGVVHFSVAGFDYVLMVVDRRILAVRAHHRLAGTLDFILDGVDTALREVLGLLAAQDAAADRRPGVGPETEGVSDADADADGERDGATVIVLPEEPRPAQAADDPTDVAGAAEAAGGQSGQEGAQTPAATTQGVTGGTTVGTAAGMADATVEMAAVVDGPVPGVPGDAEGGTGAETTDTPKPLLVS